MGEIHQLIVQHGADEARRIVGPDDRRYVDLAEAMLASENTGIGAIYSGFCLVALPHKKLKSDDEIWRRDLNAVTLLVEPGAVVEGPRAKPTPDGRTPRHGVPYGSRARLVLAYLQTQAIKTGSPEVELGRSMAEWMSRMGISDGGKDYKDVREQALRLSTCRLQFHWHNGNGRAAWQAQNIVDGGILLTDGDPRQERLWVDVVRLSQGFYRSLVDHPVPLSEAAVRAISGQSMALDVYAWLAYRLHHLEQSVSISWAALFAQFGAGFSKQFHFKPKFIIALKSALAVYEQARVDVDEKRGLTLHPSAPPVPYRGGRPLIG